MRHSTHPPPNVSDRRLQKACKGRLPSHLNTGTSHFHNQCGTFNTPTTWNYIDVSNCSADNHYILGVYHCTGSTLIPYYNRLLKPYLIPRKSACKGKITLTLVQITFHNQCGTLNNPLFYSNVIVKLNWNMEVNLFFKIKGN